MHRSLIVLLVLLSLLLIASCASQNASVSASAEPDLHQSVAYIPANTPYFFANRRVADALTTDLSWKTMTPTLRQLQWVITLLLNNQEESSDYSPVLNMLDGKLNREGFASWGIGDMANSVLYGYELFPVIRIEIADRQLLDQTLTGMLTEAGERYQMAEHKGQPYHLLVIPEDLEEDPESEATSESDTDAVDATENEYGDDVFAHLAFMTRDNELIIALYAPEEQDKLLDHMTRSVPLIDNLHNSGRLDRINQSMGYRDQSATMELDISSLMQQILAKVVDEDNDVREPYCRQEAERLFSIVPRVLLGTNSISNDRLVQTGMMVVRPDLAADLPGLVRPMPFASVEDPGFFSMGLGFNVVAIRDYLLERSTGVLESPYQCEAFAGMNESAANLQASLSQPLPPFVSSVFGIHLSVDQLDFNSSGLEALSGAMMMGIDNAPFLMAMMQAIVPELAQIDLQPNTDPVAIPAGVLPFEVDQPLMAMSDQAVVISVGEVGANRIDSYRAISSKGADLTAAPLMTFNATSEAADLFSSLDIDQMTDYFSEAGNRFPELYDWMQMQRTRVNLLQSGVQLVLETELSQP